MKALYLLSILLCVTIAHAEQRVVVVNAYAASNEGASTGMPKPDLAQVNALLNQGWRITHITSAGSGADYTAARMFTYVFVLESPATQAPSSDLKRIWQSAYEQSMQRDRNGEPVARAFADKVVAAVIGTVEAKP